MSTAAVPTTANAPQHRGEPETPDCLIEVRIAEARRALWWAEFVRESLSTLIIALIALIVWVIVDQWVYSPNVAARSIAFAGLTGWCLWRVRTRIWPLLGSSIQPAYAARSLERDLPEMKQSLTSYVTLRSEPQQPGLRSRVVRSIGSSVAGRLKSHDALPGEATGTMKWWLALIAALAILILYAAFSPKNTVASVGRLVAPLAAIDSPKRVSISEVQPGDTEAIAGRSVNVSAMVDGLKQDEPVWCRWRTNSGLQQQELNWSQSDGRFRGAIELDHAATGKIAYHIEAGDAQAGPFWLSVENVPVVALQSVHYDPPAYTREVAHTSSSGAITAIDGTQVTIKAVTNRAIEKASIEFNPRALGETVQATAGSKPLEIDESGTGLSIRFPLRSSRGRSAAVQFENYRIVVTDSAGQSNPDPIVYPIRVIADLPPEISIVMPRQTPKKLPLDGQQVIEVHAMDPDFGLKQVKLEIRRGVDVIAEPSLWRDPTGAKGNQVTEYRFRPGEHGLRIGDVVKIAALATDNRSVPDDPSIEANTARTDAIELRIVDRQPLPDQPEGNDGVSAPDDRPASDDQGDRQSQSESSTENSGESDQQQGGGGGEGSAAQQDGDSGQGSQSGESGENSESGTGGQTNDNKQPESGQQENGSGTGGESSPGDDSNASQGGQPNQSDPGEQSDPGNSAAQNPSAADGGDPSDPSSDPSPSGEPGSESTQDPNAQPAEQSSDATAGENTAGGDPSGQPQQQSGQPGAEQNTGDADSANDAPPKHDGEAFERIRDYLDKKRKEQSKGSGSQEQSQDQPNQSEGTKQPDAGEPRESPSDSSRPDDESSARNENGGREDGGQENGSQQSGESGEQSGRGTEDEAASEPRSNEPKSSAGDGQQSSSGRKTDDSQTAGGEDQKRPDENSGNDSKETAADNSDDSESPSGDPSAAQQQGNDGKQADDQPTGKQDSGDEQGGEQQPGEQGSGEQGSAEQDDGKQGSGDEPNGERGQNDSSATDQASEAANNQSEDASDANDGQPEGSSNSQDSPSESSQSKPADTGRSQQSGDPSSNSSTPPQGTPTQASGDGSGTGDAGSSPPAPAEPDLEYTKKATDMVLDYLKETRDQPDTDLLKELDWTEEDLKRFTDRWQNVREMEKPGVPDAETNRDVEEALRSLGMRPRNGNAALQNQDQADSLRGIRDAGNRQPPPPAYRDVFEAFRRAVGRQ